MTATSEPRPRCGTSTVEVSNFGDAEPSYIAACTCYPHPPLCPSCRQPLDEDGRCMTYRRFCPVYTAIVPDPIVDPLWEDVKP